MSLRQKIDALDPKTACDIFSDFLIAYTEPAFGALPKREIDILMFDMLRRLDLIDEDASIYTLMRDLKINRTKARALLYDLEIRKVDDTPGHLDAEIRELLSSTGFFKDADYFVIEVENPLVQDHLRDKIRRLGFLSDSSFNQQLVRMPLGAVRAVAEDIIPDKDREKIRKALIKAGAPDGSFGAVVEGALRNLAGKIAGKAGSEVASQAVGYMKPLFGAVGEAIVSAWKDVLTET